MSWLHVGCGLSLTSFEHRRRWVAPQSEKETGVLVSHINSTQLAQFLQDHPQTTYRVLNPQHQQFEVFNASMEELRQAWPRSAIAKNQFFKWEPYNFNQMPTLSPSAFIVSQSSLQKCQTGSTQPVSVITPHSSLGNKGEPPLFQNSPVHLSGEGSFNTAFPQKPLKMEWVIMAPGGDPDPETTAEGPDLVLAPKAMGKYTVHLVVQDENQVCGLSSIEFAVTGNKKYLGYDPLLEEQFKNIDVSSMKFLGQLHVPQAWQISTGWQILIAVVDTGINFNSLVLRNNIAVNMNEIPDNHQDDDQNGFIDDEVGWDFINGDNSPFDDEGHGSHVAGLAASPLFGVAKGAKLLAVKALSVWGGDVGSVAASIFYAVDRHAHIINLSLAIPRTKSSLLSQAIQYAEDHGVLVVAAAGNGNVMTGVGYDIDSLPVYPASFANENIIAVAAQGHTGVLATYSNFGLQSVDVVAPGGDSQEEITSAFLDNPAGILLTEKHGTSMATPIVSGVAALIWAQHPEFSFSQVKEVILKTGYKDPHLQGVVSSGRSVDALSALGDEGK